MIDLSKLKKAMNKAYGLDLKGDAWTAEDEAMYKHYTGRPQLPYSEGDMPVILMDAYMGKSDDAGDEAPKDEDAKDDAKDEDAEADDEAPKDEADEDEADEDEDEADETPLSKPADLIKKPANKKVATNSSKGNK